MHIQTQRHPTVYEIHDMFVLHSCALISRQSDGDQNMHPPWIILYVCVGSDTQVLRDSLCSGGIQLATQLTYTCVGGNTHCRQWSGNIKGVVIY